MIERQTGGGAAAQKYLGKIIEVRGIVDTANSTGDSPSISFKATGSCVIEGGNSVNCFWMAERERDAVTKIHHGDSITVLGRFGTSGKYWMPKEYDIPGCAVYINLDNCTIKGPSQSGTTDNVHRTPPSQTSATQDYSDEAARLMVAIIEQQVHPAPLDASFTPPRIISAVETAALGHDNLPTKGISGQVVLVCVVEPDGSCQHWNVLKSVEPREDQAVINGLSGVHFQPATEYGHPVAYPFVQKVYLDFTK